MPCWLCGQALFSMKSLITYKSLLVDQKAAGETQVAYEFLEGDSGEGIPLGLLKTKVGLVFNTSNTFAEREREVFGDPLERIWKDCVFGLLGLNHQRFVL